MAVPDAASELARAVADLTRGDADVSSAIADVRDVASLPDLETDLAKAVADLTESDAELPRVAGARPAVRVEAGAAPAPPSGSNRPPGVTTGLPDADVELPDAFADLPVTAPRSRPAPTEAAAAAAAGMSWPPLPEELDAVEVIDLEAIRSWAPKPLHPLAAAGGSIPTVPRHARSGSASSITPGSVRPVETPATGALAWPPPSDEVDAIAMIDLHDTASVRDAVMVPVAEADEPVVAAAPSYVPVPAAVEVDVPVAHGRSWGWAAIGLIAIAAAAGGGYVVMQRQVENQRDVPGVSAATTPASSLGSTAVAPAERPSPAAPSLPDSAGNSGTPAVAPSDAAAAARAFDEAVAASKRLLARGDRVSAVRMMRSAPAGPAVMQFVTGVMRSAAAEAELSRTATLARIPNGEALDAFRIAREQQSNAITAWRQGDFERALDLFSRATRAYQAVEAPQTASAATPVGVTGRTLDIPPAATSDTASRAETPMLPAVPAAGSGMPAARDTRTLPSLAPPVAEARPVTVPRADEAGVRRTIEAYRSAFDRLDADAASAVVPSIDSKALARAFSGLASQRLEFERCDLDVNDTTAQATCVGRAASVPKVGSSRPRVDPRRWSFVLARQADGWHITSARVSQR